MRPWTRLQDWVTLLAGVYAMTSPLVLSTVGMSGEGEVIVAMITLGAQQGLQEPRGRFNAVGQQPQTTGPDAALVR